MSQNKQYILIASIFLLINAILLVFFISGKNNKYSNIELDKQFSNIGYPEFTFNSPSPDFSESTIGGENITLSDWKGHVIIIRFSRFYLSELPFHLYLEHISQKYNSDIRLIFINSLGKHETSVVEEFVQISSPIIEDDGSLRSLFNARPVETIIIGRDYKMKFKHVYADKKIIHSLLLRYAFGESPPEIHSIEEFSELIRSILFFNLKTKKTESLAECVKGKRSLINLSISTCMTCPETSRLRLLKELANHIDHDKKQIIYLYGKGNNPKMLKDYINRMGLDKKSVLTGIIEKGKFSDSDYYRIFNFDIDPRIILFEEGGKLRFLEKIGDSGKISDINFLKNKLKR